ncbi:putative Ankyrin repeat and fyve domain containing [Fasciola hepatica]|uniref:Ankyrin repeat and fyve domain containing n=1 Tax=Fasciola hepatica TaxID=6192 RepID=A0A4E0RH70_FASHE|nr:putative Ankyrin repeat and fyve domain containing [Fasciola hepatica]
MFLVAPENRYSQALVEAGVPVNWVFTGCNSDPASTNIQPGETVLMTCARLGLEPAALFLLEQSVSPVDVSVCLESGATVFHLAVESELRDLCKCLVSKHDVNPNQFRSIRLTSELPTSAVSSSPVTEQQQREALKPADSSNKPMNPFDLFPDDDEKLHESGASFDPGAPQLTERMDPDGQGQPSTLTEVSGTVPIAENAPCERRTPLHLALLHEMYDLIELYLEHRARREPNWFLLDHDGESVFSLALWSTQFDLANRILIAASKSSYGRKLSSENVDDETRADVLAQFSAKSGLPTLLHRAVTRGQLETVRFLIRHGVDVNSSLSNSQSDSAIDLGTETEPNRLVCPLLTALMGGMQPIADILVASGADVDCWRAFSGTSILVTLLHRAIYERDEITAEYLIKNNCDVNAVAKCPSSGDYSVPHNLTCLQLHLAWKPIHMAASLGLLRIVQSLVKCTRTEISCQEAEGNTALHIAVRNGHDKIVTALLGCPVFDCTVKNVHGHTAFYVAMNSRNVKAAQSILERDPTLALQTDKLGRNFLHLAVQNVDAAAIFFLIQTGMDMNQRVADANQYTPLHLAIIAGVPEDIFRSLLLAGASTEDRTTQKYTPLHLCVVHNRPELLYCLIETGANVNEQDSEMNTPLHLAVRTGHTACLTVLLSQQTTDPCIMNVRGQFPIHLLAEHNPSIAVEMLQFLFEVTVAPQINAKDASGNTPLLLAYRANNIALCIALVHAGASMGTANTDGHSVFSLSRQRTGTAAPDRILSQILDSLVQEPRWEDGLACIECNAKFGLTTRKHHCRHCGRLLCALCSNFELPIIKFGINKPVRVCETCFYFLNNPLGM